MKSRTCSNSRAHLPVIFVAHDRAAKRVGEQREQAADPALDEMDAGRFERLEEAADRPIATQFSSTTAAAAGGEADRARLAEGLAFEVREQHGLGFVIADELAAIDVAVADAVLRAGCAIASRPVRGRAGIGQRGRHGAGTAIARSQGSQCAQSIRYAQALRSAARGSRSNRGTGRR